MGGGHEEAQFQTDQIQQHLLAALYQRLLQARMQQPRAKGKRSAFPVHFQ